MAGRDFAPIVEWLIESGLAGVSETDLLDGFCRRALAAGLPVARGGVIIDTLHPVHEGRAFRWRREQKGRAEQVEYGPTSDGQAAENWQRSPFYHLVATGQTQVRRCLAAGDDAEFPIVAAFRDEGMTDVLALINRFAAPGVIGEMDCVYSYWVTDRANGFDGDDVDQLIRLMPTLALSVKCTSLARIVGTLAETYLGRDTGRRVLGGRIGRGVAEKINAVLWYSDLRGFTRITDTAPPKDVIPLLNDYAEAVISAVHDNGGEVLKLIGDGTLAIFTADSADLACRGAIAAERAMRAAVTALNARRAAAGLPTTQVYLGLHVGDVFYGNIGSRDRLDFTVVGPTVNEVSRIASMCRSADRDVLVSAAFAAAAATSERGRMVSVGRYALRGVERPQELFTIEPNPPEGV